MLKHSSQEKGFTLIEAMIAVTLMGLLISLAVSTMSRTSHRLATSGLNNTIVALLTKTRLLAMQSGAYVSACPTTDITASTPMCTKWTDLTAEITDDNYGWVIFKDSNADGIVNNANDVLSLMAFDNGGGKVGIKLSEESENSENNEEEDKNKNVVRYNRKGQLSSGSQTLTVGSKIDKYSGKGNDKKIAIATSTGRIRSYYAEK